MAKAETKTGIVTFKVTKKEKEQMVKHAKKYADGTITDLMRKAYKRFINMEKK